MKKKIKREVAQSILSYKEFTLLYIHFTTVSRLRNSLSLLLHKYNSDEESERVSFRTTDRIDVIFCATNCTVEAESVY